MLKAIQNTLKISEFLSPKLSTRIALTAATYPYKYKRPDRESALLETAAKGHYKGAFGKRNPYWTWGEGPTVILCHGWAGRGSQLATLAIEIANSGFKAVIFDASSHGDSSGNFSSFKVMAKDIVSVSKEFDDIHAYVCHSMGGMSLMNARKQGVEAQKFVFIASPYAPLPIVEVLKTKLKVPTTTLERCKEHFADQFNANWDDLLEGEIYRDIEEPTLLVYDNIDEELPPNSILHLEQVKAQCHQADSLVTDGLGHRKILWAPEVTSRVVSFLH